MSIGERLVQARGNMAREEVAKAANISISAIAMYENDARVPRDEIKVRLANIYGRSVEELFFTNYCHEK